MGWTPGPGPTTGDDTYVGDSTDETVSGGDGNDTLSGGGGNDTLNGDAGNDTLSGDAGNDTLNGGAGADTLYSGSGDDIINAGDDDDLIFIETYDNTFGVKTVDGGNGNDALVIRSGGFAPGSSLTSVETVYSQSSVYVAAGVFAGVQNLYLNGATLALSAPGTLDLSALNMPVAFTFTEAPFIVHTVTDAHFDFSGTSGDDTLIMPVDTLVRVTASGGDGNDTLNGGAGNDRLFGNLGANILNGLGGDDTITVTGNDTVNGGSGDDIVTVFRNVVSLNADGGDGFDSLQILSDAGVPGFVTGIGAGSSFTNFEQIVIAGGGGGYTTITPGLLPTTGTLLIDANIVHATAGVTDFSAMNIPTSFTFLGHLYNATVSFTGSAGDDTFLLPSANALSLGVAFGGDGNDTISAPNGGSNMYGEAGNDVLTGSGGADNLDGGDGSDTLNGGDGNDFLVGGAGVDVINGGNGFDVAGFSGDVAISANLSTGVITGGEATGDTFSSIEGIDGTTANDVIIGSAVDNQLFGEGGDDQIDGLDGNDTLTGDAGNDILNGNVGNDTLDGGNGDDSLQGGAGDDAMSGGDGNDTFFVDSLSDTVVEFFGAGTDAVIVSVSGYTMTANVEIGAVSGGGGLTLTGNTTANILYGAAGNDTLNGGNGNDTLQGGAGSDTMNGGLGNDTFYVAQAGDVVIEAAGQGTDATIVQMTGAYTLAANVEIGATFLSSGVNITGNGGDNLLYGNAGNDILNGASGNDTIQGASGFDTMIGGLGNDTYFFEDDLDVITENANEGTDAVIVFTNSYTLGANIEIGARFLTTAYTLNGNALDNQLYGNAGNDTLNGGDGNDTIQGGGGNDAMSGGLGNDTYLVEQAGDIVTESANQGNDAVIVLISSYTLAANIEVGATFLTTGVSITGNALDNRLYGNNGADTLNGAAGADLLDGGAGADTLTGGSENDVFTFVAGQANGDTVTDFTGNGAAAGDTLRFAGYGTAAGGATFVQIDATHWQINSADGTIHDTITLANGAGVDASDWLFV